MISVVLFLAGGKLFDEVFSPWIEVAVVTVGLAEAVVDDNDTLIGIYRKEDFIP